MRRRALYRLELQPLTEPFCGLPPPSWKATVKRGCVRVASFVDASPRRAVWYARQLARARVRRLLSERGAAS